MINKNKPNLFLDLDETLISAQVSEDFNFKKNKKKMRKFNFKDMDGYYIIFERPHLQKFLDFVFKNFNVSIWTAASKDYALFIIEEIILKNHKNRKLDYIFFSYHCDVSKKTKKGIKNLNVIWDVYKLPGYNKDNTMIIDDNDEVYKYNKTNCIHIKQFDFNKKNIENDETLLDIMNILKKSLNK
jgi:TFIIF-interacting CTD phosphatase-like protein